MHISGMHGDLQGIAGASLPAIKMLEMDDSINSDQTLLSEEDGQN